MSTNPFMQLYVGDYLADTLDLTTEQHGAYLLLLMTMWRHDARLPNEPAKLARIARVSPRRWPQIWDAIGRFFFVEGDEIGNSRLDREHQKAVSISQKRIASGKAGGAAKALKNKEQDLANGTVLPKHSQNHISEPEENNPRNTEVESEGARDLFLEIWEVFPRNPTSVEAKAEKRFDQLSEHDQLALLEAAKRYARWFPEDNKRRNRTAQAGLSYVPHLSTWIETDAWRQANELPISSEQTPVIEMIRVDKFRDEEIWRACVQHTGKEPPTDGSSWAFPAELVEQVTTHLTKERN